MSESVAEVVGAAVALVVGAAVASAGVAPSAGSLVEEAEGVPGASASVWVMTRVVLCA